MAEINYCQCGCGKEIEHKHYHKWYGTPRYLFNHHCKLKVVSEETKKKISLSHIGHKYGMNGKHHSEQTKEKLRLINKGQVPWILGKTHSEQTKEKLRIANLGKTMSEESKEKNRLWHLGKKWNEERKNTRILLAKSNNNYGMKGKHHSKESNEKNRLSNLGRISPRKNIKLTEQTKIKIRLARQNQIIPRKDTKIELALQTELFNRNILFTKHKPILGQPDIFIEPNICIFADGDYWHNKIGIPERDAKVSNGLRESGYLVLRYWEKEIKANPEGCVDEIEEVLITKNVLESVTNV